MLDPQTAFLPDGVATLYHTNTAVLNTTAGGIQIEKGVQEKFATITGATGVTALDCSNGHIFYKTGCTGDITANFTNLTLTAEYAVNPNGYNKLGGIHVGNPRADRWFPTDTKLAGR